MKGVEMERQYDDMLGIAEGLPTEVKEVMSSKPQRKRKIWLDKKMRRRDDDDVWDADAFGF
jgi:hypothetical protein